MRQLIAIATIFIAAVAMRAQVTIDRDASRRHLAEGNAARSQGNLQAAIEAYRRAIETDPDSIDAHVNYISARERSRIGGDASAAKAAMAKLQEDLINEYQGRIDADPGRAAYWCALGYIASRGAQYAKAEQALSKAVELDPKLALAWAELAMLAEYRGEVEKSIECLKRASEAAPDDPNHAFYYASSLHKTDRVKWVELSLDFATRFSTNQRAAQAIYWLAARADNAVERRRYRDMLRMSFPPERLTWSASAMRELFDEYIRTDLGRAVELAEDMTARFGETPAGKAWAVNSRYARTLRAAFSLIERGDEKSAWGLLERLAPPEFVDGASLIRLKAEALAGIGKKQDAFDLLAQSVAKQPNDELQKALEMHGHALNMPRADIMTAVWKRRDGSAVKANELNLKLYTREGTVRLSDFAGKLVLISFWYPACGPCRNEFPYFQELAQKHKEHLVILAPNVHPEEDEFVLPYIYNHRYTFIPLRTTSEWAEANYGARGYPTNALLDGKGRIYFRPHVYNFETMRSLDLAIESLLARARGEGY